MAFDLPIEADKPNDLGFISSFVRAPVVGTIMWLFGGQEAKKLEAEDGDCRRGGRGEDNNLRNAAAAAAALGMDQSSEATNCDQRRQDMSSKDGVRPNCIDSDVSEDGDCCCDHHEDHRKHHAHDGTTDHVPRLVRQRGKLSWSDESGHDLVQYLDESQSALRQPPATDVSAPTRSAIRRSRSISQQTHLNKLCGEGTGLSSQHGTSANGAESHLLAGGGNNSKKPGSGYISPQWGWYISTTPPTPEMYSGRRSVMTNKKSRGGGGAAEAAVVASGSIVPPLGAATEQRMMGPLVPSSSAAVHHPPGGGAVLHKSMALYTTEEQPHHHQLMQHTMDAGGGLAPFQSATFSKGLGSNMGWPSVPL